jgi:hypothetical protein
MTYEWACRMVCYPRHQGNMAELHIRQRNTPCGVCGQTDKQTALALSKVTVDENLRGGYSWYNHLGVQNVYFGHFDSDLIALYQSRSLSPAYWNSTKYILQADIRAYSLCHWHWAGSPEVRLSSSQVVISYICSTFYLLHNTFVISIMSNTRIFVRLGRWDYRPKHWVGCDPGMYTSIVKSLVFVFFK